VSSFDVQRTNGIDGKAQRRGIYCIVTAFIVCFNKVNVLHVLFFQYTLDIHCLLS